MRSIIMSICIPVLLVYYMVAVALYLSAGRNKEFFHMVIFPLPVAIFTVFLFFDSYYNEDVRGYNAMVAVMIVLSVMIGMLVIYHSLLEFNRRGLSFFVKLLTATLLVLTPLLFYSPDYMSLVTVSYFFCGVALGILGFSLYFSNRKTGLLYVYTSLVFMVIIPVFSLVAARFYLDNYEPEIIYRRAEDDWISCHAIAIPLLPRPEGPGFSLLFGWIYLSLFAVMAAIRKNRLERRLKREGVIPAEFYQITTKEDFK